MSCRQRRTWSGSITNLCDYNSVISGLVKQNIKYLVKIDLKYLVKQNLKYLVKIDLKYLVEQNFKYLVMTDLDKLKTNLPATRRLSTEGGTMMP